MRKTWLNIEDILGNKYLAGGFWFMKQEIKKNLRHVQMFWSKNMVEHIFLQTFMFEYFFAKNLEDYNFLLKRNYIILYKRFGAHYHHCLGWKQAI